MKYLWATPAGQQFQKQEPQQHHVDASVDCLINDENYVADDELDNYLYEENNEDAKDLT